MDVFICDKDTLAVLDKFLAAFYVLNKLKFNFRFIATVLIWAQRPTSIAVRFLPMALELHLFVISPITARLNCAIYFSFLRGKSWRPQCPVCVRG